MNSGPISGKMDTPTAPNVPLEGDGGAGVGGSSSVAEMRKKKKSALDGVSGPGEVWH